MAGTDRSSTYRDAARIFLSVMSVTRGVVMLLLGFALLLVFILALNDALPFD